MNENFSTRQAARQLGLAHSTLSNYIQVGKVAAPKSITSGGTTVHIWSKADIERVRKLLPRLANGRKTRYQKQKSGDRSQKSEAKSKTKKKPQPRAAHGLPGSSTVPHKQRRKKH